MWSPSVAVAVVAGDAEALERSWAHSRNFHPHGELIGLVPGRAGEVLILSIDWGRGTWTRPPRSAERSDDGLRVEAEEGSDFWQRTLYGFTHDDGHALLAPVSADGAVEVSFDLGDLTELYDQAGLLIRAGSDRWIKAGVEVSDGVAHVGVVVTNGASDWSMSPIPEWQGVVTVRLSQLRGAAVVRARTEHEGWRTIRVAPMIPGDSFQAGPMVCAPTRAGLQVTFRSWRETAPDVDLHIDPPG